MKSRIVGFGFVGIVILATVFPLLSGRRIAFRDASHFYLPLYDYVAQRTQSEWMPLWNPLDQTGLPLVGESSTAVLYPVRYAIYALPLSAELSLNLYLVFHLLLAGAGAAWLGRRYGLSGLGIVTAAIAYPLSGSVLSLCCNPPFLVGAAYLPFALSALLGRNHESTHRPSSPFIAGLFDVSLGGVSMAMMVLGGDPQSALHCVLVVIAATVASTYQRWRQPEVDSFHVQWRSHLWHRSLVITSSSVIAILLAAPQVAASIDWSRQSDRTSQSHQRNDIYDFSIAPWHIVETLSPRPFGHPFPINRRISKLIPGDGRMWTPTIYAGVLVGVSLLFYRRRESGRRADFFGWLVVCSFLLCMGHFGLIWLVQQVPGVFPDADSSIGGLYWVLNQTVPGYDSFRYPAKWLPMFSIGAAMIAGRWLTTKPNAREQTRLLALAGLFLILAAIVHVVRTYWDHNLLSHRTPVPRDEYWGPLNLPQAFSLMRASFLWSMLMLITVFAIRRWQQRNDAKTPSDSRWSKRAGALLVAVLAIDCFVSGHGLLPTVSIRQERSIANRIAPETFRATRTLRTQNGAWPERWRRSDSPDRPLQVAASERVAWFGRWHLAEQQAVLNSMVSIRSRAWADFWNEVTRAEATMPPTQRAELWKSIRRWLGVDMVSHVDGTKAVASDGMAFAHVERRKINDAAFARVTPQWKPATNMRAIIESLSQSVVPDIPFVAIGDSKRDTEEDVVSREPERSMKCRLSQRSRDRFAVHSESGCLLVRSVFQDGNWQAELKPAGEGSPRLTPVLPSSFLNQAVFVPAGDWEVTFEYRPWWKLPAIYAAVAGIVIVVTLPLIATVLRMRRLGDC
ncbi:hypothetical protein [Roseiconus lacunae]|uniref:hypothetical protein n=1 Tax=Roseiconus lacunae TaxID=2605694 RepID=UPI001E2EAE2E|nr:hypothetical protein [Roseiconus lacunae]MCD0462863.1 hypothetical protein [Roseiconus lacunae]